MVRDWIPLDRFGSAKVGPKGQIVIPKAMRDRADIKAGGQVFLSQAEDGTITVEKAWNDPSEVFTYFDRYPVLPGMEGKTALDILHEMDAEDEAHWERKFGPWPKADSSSTPSPSSAPTKGRRSGRSSRTSSTTRSRGGASSA